MATAKKEKFGVLEGVLVYAKVGQPDFKYKDTVDKEWSVQVIVDEDTADIFDAKFKKQPAKKIKATEFESKFKIPLPAQFKGEKNVFSITLRRQATNEGVPVDDFLRPKVYVDFNPTKESPEGERVEIGQSRLVANGSVGKVSYYISWNEKAGTDIARLQNILMTEEGFVEYESTAKSAGSEFGDSNKAVKTEAPTRKAMETRKEKAPTDEDDEQQVKEEAPAKASPKQSTPKKPKAPMGDDEGDSSPF